MSLSRATPGAALAALVAAFSFRYGVLSVSGSVAAVVIGTAAAAAGWDWAALLLVFFVTGSVLSRARARAGATAATAVEAKHGPRDARQVFANGGAFACAALGSLLAPAEIWQVLGAGALAASTADTWATEIGIRSGATPRSIVSWRPVATGSSGGVSPAGTLAAAAGAGLIALTGVLLEWPVRAVAAALAGGFAGAMLDSVLGATLQARRWCEACGLATERIVHACGSETRLTGGLRLMDNDAVNAVSSLAAAGIGALIGL